jgi:predicted lactoylglutathione lyase
MKMNGKLVGYTTLGTNNLKQAKIFYDSLFENIKEIYSFEEKNRCVIWANDKGNSIFGVFKPHDNKTATPGNGSMIGFSMDSKDMVDELYFKAINLGAVDEGCPGFRDDRFYGAYVRDLDKNKIVFYYYDDEN